MGLRTYLAAKFPLFDSTGDGLRGLRHRDGHHRAQAARGGAVERGAGGVAVRGRGAVSRARALRSRPSSTSMARSSQRATRLGAGQCTMRAFYLDGADARELRVRARRHAVRDGRSGTGSGSTRARLSSCSRWTRISRSSASTATPGYPLIDASRPVVLGLIAVGDRAARSTSRRSSSRCCGSSRCASMRSSSARARAAGAARLARRATARSSRRARTRSSSTTGTRGAIVDVNPQACARTATAARSCRTLRLAELSAGVPPYTDEEGLRWIERAKGEGSVRFEWHRRNRDGSLHWDEVRLKAARIGGQRRVLAFTREITETQGAEQALRASEEQYRTMFNASADALVLWNSRSERVDVNPAYERMYGYSRERGAGGAARTSSCPRSISGCRRTSSAARSKATAIVRRDRDRAARRRALSDRGAHRPDPVSRRAARAGDDPRPDRATAGRGRAHPARGAAAPGAEDGGDRPAHRRHRARLQQPAHQHHGLRVARRRTGERRSATGASRATSRRHSARASGRAT